MVAQAGARLSPVSAGSSFVAMHYFLSSHPGIGVVGFPWNVRECEERAMRPLILRGLTVRMVMSPSSDFGGPGV